MKIAGKKVWYLEYILIIVGTGLMATAITSCFDAAGMVTGGFSGIAILVKAWTKGVYGDGIPLWITNLQVRQFRWQHCISCTIRQLNLF